MISRASATEQAVGVLVHAYGCAWLALLHVASEYQPKFDVLQPRQIRHKCNQCMFGFCWLEASTRVPMGDCPVTPTSQHSNLSW